MSPTGEEGICWSYIKTEDLSHRAEKEGEPEGCKDV